MNYPKLGNIIGKIMCLEGLLMLAPLVVSLIYKEPLLHQLAFAIPITYLLVFGSLFSSIKPKKNSLYQKEGFALVALVWIVMTVFGAVPFVINGDIPNYIDAFLR
jgi:trk system potassium uptake protein TrkH